MSPAGSSRTHSGTTTSTYSGTTTSAQTHRQALQASDQRGGAPGELVRVGVERQVREAGEQAGERDLALQAGERCAEAVVDAVPERQVAARLPPDVQRIGVRIAFRVPVGRGQRDE